MRARMLLQHVSGAHLVTCGLVSDPNMHAKKQLRAQLRVISKLKNALSIPPKRHAAQRDIVVLCMG